MKNGYKSGSPKAKRTKASRWFGDRNLLVVFAALSLAFALFYTFADNATNAAHDETITAAAPAANAENFAVNRSIDAALSPATVADVVAKAQAFKATLTASQTTTLQQAIRPRLPAGGRICRAAPAVATAFSSAH